MPDIRPPAAHAVRYARPRAPHVAAFLGINEAEVAALADRLLAQTPVSDDTPPPPYDVAVRLPPPYAMEAPSRVGPQAPRRLPRPAGARRVSRRVPPLPALVPHASASAGRPRPTRLDGRGARPGALPLLAGAALTAAAGCMVSAAQRALHGSGPGTLLLLAALLGWLTYPVVCPTSSPTPGALEFDPMGRGRAQSPWPVAPPRFAGSG